MTEKPTLIILVGIPGSGKTTYADEYVKSHYNTDHLSSDLIRAELYGDESTQGDPAEVFSLMQKRAVDALNDGKNVVYDATNITRKDRACIINVCPKFAKIECHIIWEPIDVCIERDSMRNRTVGKAVIDKMLKRFQAPFFDEGIHEIKIVKHTFLIDDSYEEECLNAMDIPHDNPHHTLDIGDHCAEAYQHLVNNGVKDNDVLYAALSHDVGKPYTKAFVDSKGEHCEQAHFYQHHCVGAWIHYGFTLATPRSAWLISTHMDPFLNTKYYRNLPPFLKRYVDILHEADLNAH